MKSSTDPIPTPKKMSKSATVCCMYIKDDSPNLQTYGRLSARRATFELWTLGEIQDE